MLDRRALSISVAEDQRSSGSDRRVAQRYPTGGTPALLSWKEGDEYRSVEVSLRDISLSGVSMMAKDAVPKGVPLWFRVRSDDTSEWVETSLVGLSKTGMLGLGPRLIRLRFAQPCPYHVFKLAIEGFSLEYQDLELSLGGIKKRDWR